MALDDDIRILSGVGLFDGLSHDQLRLLAFGAERMQLMAGEVLYREGEPADTALVVVAGGVTLFREADGARRDLGSAGPGAMLGELALIAPTRRMTGAIAHFDTELIRLGRKLFRRILDEYPEVAAALRERIAGELQDMIRRIESLAPRLAPND